MRGFGFLGAIGVLLIALIGGAIGYSLGVGANVATVATNGTPVAYPVYGWHFGFPFFGLFFGLLFLFLIFGVIRRIAWGRRGWGGPAERGGFGPGDYRRGSWYGATEHAMPPFADEMLQRWHQQAHGNGNATGPDAPASGPSSSTAATSERPAWAPPEGRDPSGQ